MSLVVLFHEFTTQDDETADYLELDFVDFNTKEVVAFLKAVGSSQKEKYSREELRVFSFCIVVLPCGYLAYFVSRSLH